MESILKIVVIGEVDSGKSTLIGRFLYDMGAVYKESIEQVKRICQGLKGDFEFAYLLDSFEEERKNQLTIDTTQVFCKNRGAGGFLFIDIPGHRQLLKNMLSGSSYADVAIVVIDVQKSIEEGTRRHIYVLQFLGIEKIVVILNKMDLVNFAESVFEGAKRKILDFSRNIGVQVEQIIPVSAKQGANLIKKSSAMSWHKGLSLIDALELLNKRLKKKEGSGFYFPIQDVYCLGGKKVYVGSVISGEIKKGDRVKIAPVDKESVVREIKIFNKNKMQAKAKESIGLVLEEIDNIQRGQVIYKNQPPEITDQFLAKIFCVSPISIDKQLTLKCATQQSLAKIKQINNATGINKLEVFRGEDNLNEWDAAEVIIATEKPLALKRFRQLNALGRFVLQDDKKICAAGIIP